MPRRDARSKTVKELEHRQFSRTGLPVCGPRFHFRFCVFGTQCALLRSDALGPTAKSLRLPGQCTVVRLGAPMPDEIKSQLFGLSSTRDVFQGERKAADIFGSVRF
jgi:hypothetical protein